MDGPVALVTGASRGIGRAIALRLSAEGYRIGINFQHREEAALETAERIRQHGGSALVLQADVSNEQQVKTMFMALRKSWELPSVLVNNAGITSDGLLMRMKPEDWMRVLDVSLTGSYLCSRAALRGMAARKSGVIINLTSPSGQAGRAGQCNYAAAKAGIIGLTRSLAQEMAPLGIRVNAVSPGFIETEMTDSLPDSVKQELLQNIPLGRFGQPEEIADMVAFLVSENAIYITGQIFAVNGGLVMV